MEQNWGIIGHQNIIKFLKNSLNKNRLANTYLFYGIAGLGKVAVAEKFAQEIIGEGRNQITELYPLKPQADKKDISIEQVREWRRSLGLKSFSSDNYKVGLIYEAEKLNQESANALLKTIEEPTAKTVIIIVTSDWQKMLGTIVSRSVKIKFLPVPALEIKKSLVGTVKDKKKLEQIVVLANGRPQTATSLATDEALLDKYLKYRNLIYKLFKVSINRRWQVISELLDSLKDLQSKAKAATAFLDHFETGVRSLFLANWQIDYLPGFEPEVKLSPRQASALLSLAARAKRDLRANLQPKLVLENLLINL